MKNNYHQSEVWRGENTRGHFVQILKLNEHTFYVRVDRHIESEYKTFTNYADAARFAEKQIAA